MTPFYLWVNAALYAVFAAWCALKVEGTSRSLGYTSLNASGYSEYLTVYGGLQIGLAVFFAWTAWRPELQRTGLVLAIALYAPIVLMRWGSIARHWPVDMMTVVVGGLETTLLAAALLLWHFDRPGGLS